jgi:Fe-S oxidoreductase
MLRVFYPQLLAGTPQEQAANDLAARTYEFGEFLVRRLGVEDVGARFPHRVTYHDGCHGLRELRVKDEPRRLLRAVRDLERVRRPARRPGILSITSSRRCPCAVGDLRAQAIAGHACRPTPSRRRTHEDFSC